MRHYAKTAAFLTSSVKRYPGFFLQLPILTSQEGLLTRMLEILFLGGFCVLGTTLNSSPVSSPLNLWQCFKAGSSPWWHTWWGSVLLPWTVSSWVCEVNGWKDMAFILMLAQDLGKPEFRSCCQVTVWPGNRQLWTLVLVIIEVDPPASLPMMLGAKVSFLIAKLLPLPLFSDTKNTSSTLEYKEAGLCPEGTYVFSCGEIICYVQITEFPKHYQTHMQKQRPFIQARSWTLCVSDTEVWNWRALSSVGVGFFFLSWQGLWWGERGVQCVWHVEMSQTMWECLWHIILSSPWLKITPILKVQIWHYKALKSRISSFSLILSKSQYWDGLGFY